jgi:solute carrier family 25 (mitochondrial carnitine/acylcarnitine transporter), member 20/29
LAGQIAWISSIGFDTVKSTIQTSEKPMSVAATTRFIVSTRGFWSLFAGIEVAVVRAFPANAALFVGYELSRKLMVW